MAAVEAEVVHTVDVCWRCVSVVVAAFVSCSLAKDGEEVTNLSLSEVTSTHKFPSSSLQGKNAKKTLCKNLFKR